MFRTYNASITLHNLLQETKEGTQQQKKAQYDAANKEVAILCNHQKGVSKAHDTQMAKMRDKTEAMEVSGHTESRIGEAEPPCFARTRHAVFEKWKRWLSRARLSNLPQQIVRRAERF